MTIGIIPTADAFLPTDTNTQIAVLASTVSSLALLGYVATPAVAVAGTVALLAAGWLHHRWETRASRHGYVFDEPYTFVDSSAVAKPEGNANWELTTFLRACHAITADAIVTETTSEQYRIIKIPNYNAGAVKKQLDPMSMIMGIALNRMQFIPMLSAGISALLVHRPSQQWQAVAFDYSQLVAGELVGYLGKDILGNAITYRVEHAMHILYAGKSGAGKTEAMLNDMESMRHSGTPVDIYIVDPKNSAQLKRQQSAFYTESIEAGIQKLTQLMTLCDQRGKKYSAAGCDDFFEYRAKVDPNEPALFFYIDELAEFFMEDLEEVLEPGQHKRHKRARHVVQLSIQKQRAFGLFMRLGTQTPKASIIDTLVSNNTSARIVCSVEDADASDVAGVKGAERLPMRGGVIFKYQDDFILGRAAYLKAA
jgi:hypothetical protein